MTHESSHVIIDGYKQSVTYYGIGPFPAWVIAALPVVTFIVGALVF